MKLLVVGASGFIGRHLLAHARSMGMEAIGTRAHSSRPGLVPFDLTRDRLADCMDGSFFESGDVYVAITAVVSNMDACLTDPNGTHLINVEKTIQLLEDVRSLGGKSVYVSTNYVFDGSAGYYDEECLLAPANAYGRQKAEVEEHLGAHSPDTLIVRLDKNVGDDPDESHPFSEWYRLRAANKPIVCIEGQLLSPTYVDDTARAILIACQQSLTGVYHVVNSEYFYRDELARQFCRAVGKAPQVTCRPLGDFQFADRRALKAYLDGSKFTAATGMRFTPMSEVMRRFARRVTVR